MKRAFTEDQCNRIFASLTPARKRALIGNLNSTELNVGYYVDPKLFKDILPIVTLYLDITTWSRLKRACTTFARLLQLPHPVPLIIAYYHQNAQVPRVYEYLKTNFWFYINRFMKAIHYSMTNYSYLNLKHNILSGSSVRVNFPFKHDNFHVHYPTGYIFRNGIARGTIWTPNIENLLFKQYVVGRPSRMLSVVQYSAEMKVIHKHISKHAQKYK